jgi:hypothetical protein
MLAISLWQPWASLIACRAKRFETRSWATQYRGPLAIHAAKRWEADQRQAAEERPIRPALEAAGIAPGQLPLGAIVAFARLVEVSRVNEDGTLLEAIDSDVCYPTPRSPEADFGNFMPGRCAWRLQNVVRLVRPIACRGDQGLWHVPAEIERMVVERLREQVPSYQGVL